MSNLNAGAFYLITNSNVLDQYLLDTQYLLSRITQIRNDKINSIETELANKRNDLTTLQKAMFDDTIDPSMISRIQQTIDNLQIQIDDLMNKSNDPTISDIQNTHNIFLSSIYKPSVSIGYWYSQSSGNNAPIFGSTYRIPVPVYGNFFTDMVLNMKLSSFSATHPSNKVKYCDFPGHRLFKKIKFILNDVIIDSYETEDINQHYDFNVSKSQADGWKRCVGQELPKCCFFTQDPLNQEIREEKIVYDGFQTLKHTQNEMEIFLPLNFWFCNPKYAMNNFNIVYGKTFIEIDIATAAELTVCADYMSDGGKYTYPTIQNCSLFTNHIFVTPEVAEILSAKSALTLIRIHKQMQRTLNIAKDQVMLNDLKFAIEDLKIVFRPTANVTNDNAMETWNKNMVITYTEVSCPSIINSGGTKSLGCTDGYYYTETSVVNSLGVISGGTTLYDNLNPTFYDSYLPYRYGKDSVLTPSKSGSYLLTFNLFPNEEQPSGYFNMSNARETYLKYNSSYISSTNTVNLFISAKTMNFLLLEEGTATVRFIT